MNIKRTITIIGIVVIGLLLNANIKFASTEITAREVVETDFNPYEIGLNRGGSQSFGHIDANIKFEVSKRDTMLGYKAPSWWYKSRGVEIFGPIKIFFGFKADSNFVSVFSKGSIGKRIIKGDSTFYTIITKVPQMQRLDVSIKTFTEQNTSSFAPNIDFQEFEDSLNRHSDKLMKKYFLQHPEEIESTYVENATTFFYAYVKPFDKKIKLNLKIEKQ